MCMKKTWYEYEVGGRPQSFNHNLHHHDTNTSQKSRRPTPISFHYHCWSIPYTHREEICVGMYHYDCHSPSLKRFWSTLHIYYIWITNNKLDTSSCFLLLFLYCSSLDAGSTHPLLPYNTQQPRVTCFVNWIHQAVGPLFWVSQFTGAGLGLFLLPPAY